MDSLSIKANSRNKISEEHYEELFSKIGKIMKEYDPCQIDDHGVCSRYKEIYYAKDEIARLLQQKTCCQKPCGTACNSLGESGCKTQNLACGSFFCNHAEKSLPEEIRQQLDQFAKQLDFLFQKNGSHLDLHYRKPKELLLDRISKEKCASFFPSTVI